MSSKKMVVKTLVVLTGLLMLSSSNALAQTGPCVGDLNCDGEVSGLDTILYKADYPRSEYLGEPCPDYNPRCFIDCEGTLSASGRWCNQGDGTVKDMSTGLVWLQKADWGGIYPLWAVFGDPDAHHRAAQLWDGSPYEGSAGLSDEGSVEGDWRLPTKTELVGITVGDEYIRSSQMHFFTGVQADDYWSGTSYATSPYGAWVVGMLSGSVGTGNKSSGYYVWPVRSDN